jgi:uncharacterized metal-binding protein YceD (DUF177 family)
MTEPELSRTVRADTLGGTPRAMHVQAGPQEREALARRFGIAGVESLEAELDVARAGGEVVARGRIVAAVVQSCVVTGEPVPERIDEAFEIHFRPEPAADAEEEIELGEGELDVIFYDGALVDLGEAVAQTLALNLDPYPRAPGAADALRQAGVQDESEAGPFGALASLKEKLSK